MSNGPLTVMIAPSEALRVVDDPSTGEVTNFQFLPDVEFKFP